MANFSPLSNIYWQRKIKEKEIVLSSDGKYFSLRREMHQSDTKGFFRVSRNNSLSKLAIISSVFSFLLNKYFDDYQDIISIYPSDCVNLEKTLLLEIGIDKGLTFKDLLQLTVLEMKEAFSYTDYDNDLLDLRNISNFSILFKEKENIPVEGISLFYEENDAGSIILTLSYKDIYPIYKITGFFNNICKIIKDYNDLLNGDLDYFSLLDEQEKKTILIEFNNTYVDYPRNKTIVDLFEEQVKRTPTDLAVIFEKKGFTYIELNGRANQLAGYLRDKYQIEHQQIIATLLPKSMDLIVALLAIEKLSCIYLPIDVDCPQDRINYILKESQPGIIISNSSIFHAPNMFHLDNAIESNILDTYSTEDIHNNLYSNDSAYLIYTSGSTGNPKGVLVEHHSSINMSLDQIRKFDITSKDRVVWFASVAFDASISEILMSFFSGATLCIPTKEQQKDKENFILFLQLSKATVITFPPSYLDLLTIKELRGLKTIITAGEPARALKAKEVVQSGINYFNAYGPTEYSVCTSIFKLHKENDYLNIPIGYPISNTQVYILDESLNIVPIGVMGTLYVSGAGLSRGYLNNPELTSEKFIDNPFLRGTKMYNTGDLAMWLPDGNLEFLGRNDSQVKIRGYRVELGEIERHLLQFNDCIKQVVVSAKEMDGKEKVLIAYYTTEERKLINKTELRQYIQSRLPEYMVPNYFVQLESIPLTLNGKIDYKALPEVKDNDLIKREYVSPRNSVEQNLVKIWQEVLGVEKIGITDDFFELGGHSLTLIKVTHSIEKHIGIKLSTNQLFEVSNIMQLSDLISNTGFEENISECTKEENETFTV